MELPAELATVELAAGPPSGSGLHRGSGGQTSHLSDATFQWPFWIVAQGASGCLDSSPISRVWSTHFRGMARSILFTMLAGGRENQCGKAWVMDYQALGVHLCPSGQAWAQTKGSSYPNALRGGRPTLPRNQSQMYDRAFAIWIASDSIITSITGWFACIGQWWLTRFLSRLWLGFEKVAFYIAMFS